MVFYAGAVNAMSVILLILGISFYSNLFPSIEDALALKDNLYGKNGKNLFVKIILAPFTAVVIFGAYIERYSVSILTSIAAAAAFPFVSDCFLGVINKIMMNIG